MKSSFRFTISVLLPLLLVLQSFFICLFLSLAGTKEEASTVPSRYSPPYANEKFDGLRNFEGSLTITTRFTKSAKSVYKPI